MHIISHASADCNQSCPISPGLMVISIYLGWVCSPCDIAGEQKPLCCLNWNVMWTHADARTQALWSPRSSARSSLSCTWTFCRFGARFTILNEMNARWMIISESILHFPTSELCYERLLMWAWTPAALLLIRPASRLSTIARLISSATRVVVDRGHFKVRWRAIYTITEIEHRTVLCWFNPASSLRLKSLFQRDKNIQEHSQRIDSAGLC